MPGKARAKTDEARGAREHMMLMKDDATCVYLSVTVSAALL